MSGLALWLVLVATRTGLSEPGSPLSDWFLTLRAVSYTSKAYCGIAPGDGTAAAVQCTGTKNPGYTHQFMLLVRDSGSSSTQLALRFNVGQASSSIPKGWSPLAYAARPIVTGEPVLLLSRNAGLCNTGIGTHTVSVVSGVGADSKALPTRPGLGPHLFNWGNYKAQPRQWYQTQLSNSAERGDTSAAVPNDLPLPVVQCRLAQPSLRRFRLYKSSLKDNETLDLSKESFWLKEEDKFCTLADANGTKALLTCQQDTTSWAYGFMLQPTAYPAASLASLARGPCGIASVNDPPPHDVMCGANPIPGRTYRFSLLLQSPGSPLVSGSVVGLFTFQEGLVGLPLQQCCPLPGSPHVVTCEPPNGQPMPTECWFDVYKVVRKSIAAHGSESTGTQASGAVVLHAYMPEARAVQGDSASQGQVWLGAVVQRLYHWLHWLMTAGRAASSSGSIGWSIGGAGSSGRRQLLGDVHGGGDGGVLDGDGAPSGSGEVLLVPLAAADPIVDGELVMLRSRAFGRYCSVSVDGSLLCVSSQASNATRNLFALHLDPWRH